ncbi:MAG: N-acetylmuramoyl-L-alanine amidase [Bacteroidetes bacterium HGW-Bacteroidetes-1]|jgi:hypothetical protein|nr:MAG: N-acetylmuramoyl-L-alanine amidase [Bacteroidetes bacterium HGW-Bacteroidetes-1]
MTRNDTLPVVFLSILLSISALLNAQKKFTSEEYIQQYKEVAMEKMREYKIPASITLAQGILESGSGNSLLATKANNHFGIKCHKGWNGAVFHTDDDEKNECFRAYNKPDESFKDHSLFLTERPRYAPLFTLDIMDYKAWAQGLSKAGYATNPRYPELLIRIIERYDLHQYDHLAMKKKIIVKKPVDKIEDHNFIPINPTEFEVVGKSSKGRYIHENNRRKLIFALEDDQIKNLASEFAIYSWQIVKYNEFDKKEKLKKGQIVYLEKKRRRSYTHDTHVLKEGESLHAVSQLYGIRLKRLYKMNHIYETPKAGMELKLR